MVIPVKGNMVFLDDPERTIEKEHIQMAWGTSSHTGRFSFREGKRVASCSQNVGYCFAIRTIKFKSHRSGGNFGNQKLSLRQWPSHVHQAKGLPAISRPGPAVHRQGLRII